MKTLYVLFVDCSMEIDLLKIGSAYLDLTFNKTEGC